MTSEEKVIALFKEVCKDELFNNRAVCDEKYLYHLYMLEASRYEINKIKK